MYELGVAGEITHTHFAFREVWLRSHRRGMPLARAVLVALPRELAADERDHQEKEQFGMQSRVPAVPHLSRYSMALVLAVALSLTRAPRS